MTACCQNASVLAPAAMFLCVGFPFGLGCLLCTMASTVSLPCPGLVAQTACGNEALAEVLLLAHEALGGVIEQYWGKKIVKFSTPAGALSQTHLLFVQSVIWAFFPPWASDLVFNIHRCSTDYFESCCF